MTELDVYSLQPIGAIHSSLQRREDAPRQGFEGAPEAWVVIYPRFIDALGGMPPVMKL